MLASLTFNTKSPFSLFPNYKIVTTLMLAHILFSEKHRGIESLYYTTMKYYRK